MGPIRRFRGGLTRQRCFGTYRRWRDDLPVVFEPGGKHILLSSLANPSSFNDVLQTDMNAGDFGPRQRDLWVVRCASPFDLARAALA